jgi:hypothetical protein
MAEDRTHIWIHLMTGHHTTGYGRIQDVVHWQVASKTEGDTSGRDTRRTWRLYYDGQVGVDLGDIWGWDLFLDVVIAERGRAEHV